ncbi:MAG: hypothetical protein ACI8QZ_002364 [Chlamydiales bacterium]|jgi:hypothetical protein
MSPEATLDDRGSSDAETLTGSAEGPWAGRRAWLIAILVVAFCSTARIWGTLNDPNFDREEVSGLLRSDPGLLYYITGRILEADGGIPADFHADARVQCPDEVDLARMFTVGQEFLAAWAYRAFGGDMPLHMFCMVFFSILASLTALGVFGVAFELTGRWRWAALAALLYAGIPVNLRTTGFILIREDLSIPLFTLHLWSLARLWRRPSITTAILSGLALTAALATWHAMGFVVALEIAAITGAFLFHGANPFARAHGWVLFGVVLATSQLVPVLRAKLFLLSLPVVLAAALAATAALATVWPGRPGDDRRVRQILGRLVLWAGSAAVLFATSATIGRLLFENSGDYDHVVGLLLAKLEYLGQPPSDPTLLTPDVRLLWQGPFATAAWQDLAFGMPLAILAGLFATIVGLRSRRPNAGFTATLCFLALGTVAGILIRRTLVLPGMLGPIAVVVALEQCGRQKLAQRMLGVLSVAGMGFVLFALTGAPLVWYAPGQRVQEIRRLVHWASKNLPPGATILGDFVASTALLAESDVRIALQPKYETTVTRRRIEEFYATFTSGTPEEMRALATRLECDYLLVDTETLWGPGRYICGIPASQTIPTAGTCAYFFINGNPASLTGVPGFKLLYRSPPELGRDQFRLFRVQPVR